MLYIYLVFYSTNSYIFANCFFIVNFLWQDDTATNADSKENPVMKIIPLLKRWFPKLTVACDVSILRSFPFHILSV